MSFFSFQQLNASACLLLFVVIIIALSGLVDSLPKAVADNRNNKKAPLLRTIFQRQQHKRAGLPYKPKTLERNPPRKVRRNGSKRQRRPGGPGGPGGKQPLRGRGRPGKQNRPRFPSRSQFKHPRRQDNKRPSQIRTYGFKVLGDSSQSEEKSPFFYKPDNSNDDKQKPDTREEIETSSFTKYSESNDENRGGETLLIETWNF